MSATRPLPPGPVPPGPVHGGLDLAELRDLGLAWDDVIDLSVNVNPLGPPPGVREAIAAVDPAVYPDRACLALREALAATLDTEVRRILVGNGSTELIHLLAATCLRPGDAAVILAPAFGEYEAACDRAGAAVHRIVAPEDTDFRWDLDAVTETVRRRRPGLVFVADPNNPTGTMLDPQAIGRIAASATDGLVVVDEAYMALADDPRGGRALLGLPNVVILRSMTKDHALAALRLGYLVASPRIVERVAWRQPSWSVSGVAQAAGIAALETGPDHLRGARAVITDGKAYLRDELAALGLRVLPSAANFLLVEVGDAPRLRRALLSRGVVVRDCTSFGLPRFIRVGIRRRDECQRLVAGLREVLGRG